MANLIKVNDCIVNVDLVTDARWDAEQQCVTLYFIAPETHENHTRTFDGETGQQLVEWLINNATDVRRAKHRIKVRPSASARIDEDESLKSKRKSVMTCPTSFYTD